MKAQYRIILISGVFVTASVFFISSILYYKKKIKFDTLTKVLNRYQFNKDYEKEKYNGIIICDIDYFKSCNNTYGHEFGDYVLKKVARQLIKMSVGKNRVYRYGGE